MFLFGQLKFEGSYTVHLRLVGSYNMLVPTELTAIAPHSTSLKVWVLNVSRQQHSCDW